MSALISAPAVTAKARQALLDSMTPDTKKVAIELEKRRSATESVRVLMDYDIGAHVAHCRSDENKFGTKSIDQLSQYLGIDTTLLYSYEDIAKTYTRDYIKEKSSIAFAGSGQYLTIKHWQQLAKLASRPLADKLLNRVFRESLSANQLEQEIKVSGNTQHVRSGGRNPKKPTSAVAGLQSFTQMTNRVVNYKDTLEKHVFAELAEVTPDKITDNYLTRLEQTKEAVHQGQEMLKVADVGLTKNITRVKTVLDNRAKDEAKAAKAPAATAKAPATAGKTPAKPTTAAKPGTAKPGAKAPATARRPVPAT